MITSLALVLLLAAPTGQASERVCRKTHEQGLEREYCSQYGGGEQLTRTSEMQGDRRHGLTRQYYSRTRTLDDPYVAVEASYRDGLLHGTRTVFYPSGKVRERWHHVAGARDGEATLYYESGGRKARGAFSRDRPTAAFVWYSEGGDLRQGTVSDDDDIGFTRTRATYADGLRHGAFEELDRFDHVVASGQYTEGLRSGTHRRYVRARLNEKHVSEEYTYARGVKQGLGRTFHYGSGTVETEGNFVDGLPDGLHKSYRADGALHEEVPYRQGRRQGLMRLYSPDGSLRAETPYRDDKAEGVRKTYSPDGSVLFTDAYVNGLRHGPWVRYAPDGAVLEKRTYHQGEIVP